MMERDGRGRSGIFWWALWMSWCVPAGALAGAGLIEFNWGGPPYDGGFMGDLVLFGGFLALGQAPFMAVFFRSLSAEVGGGRRLRHLGDLASAVWPFAGFIGWTIGSVVEVGSATPLYSNASVLAGVLPWVGVAVLQGGLLGLVLAFGTVGGRRGSNWEAPARRVRIAAFGFGATVWVSTAAVGGLLYEYWRSFDVAARQNPVNHAIGVSLEGRGVAENVALGVVPDALFVPIFYGIPTGLALLASLRIVRRRRQDETPSDRQVR